MSISDNQRDYVRALTAQHPNLVRTLGLSSQPFNSREASAFIDTLKSECLERYGYRAGSIRAILADELMSHGMEVLRTYDDVVIKLGNDIGYGSYTRTLEFSNNRNGIRVPKSDSAQRQDLVKLLGNLAAEMRRRGTRPAPAPAPDIPADTPSLPDNSSEEVESSEPTPEPETAPEDNNSGTHPFLEKIREIRRIETERSEVEGKRTPILTSVSGNRPAKNGAKMLKQGIPTEALLHSLALDWPQEARSRYGIRDYDVTKFRNGPIPEHRHPAYAYVHRAMEARVPIALIGPAGTGKSTLCSQLANDLGLPYGMVPMTAGATPGWIVGAYTLEGYRSRPAMECFANGGVFVFEEMDSADPNMLLVANNLIENEVFDNPVTGDTVHRHKDFIPVACMNTRGLGGTAENTGRTRLDGATRDRFAMGRVELFLDENLETEIFETILSS